MLTTGPSRRAMDRLVRPTSIAVVGASPANPWGRNAIGNLRWLGFTGSVMAVNPGRDEVMGFPCVPRLSDLPWVPDAIVLNLPAERVEPVLIEAAELGVGAAVAFGVGFAEAGPSGQERQRRLTDIAREADLALLGPNCQGFVNFRDRSAQYMDRVVGTPVGSAALVSQSGSLTTALANNNRGLAWSHLASVGNEAVVACADLIEYFIEEPAVRVICAVVEEIRHPDRFFDACERSLLADKPVVVLKTGRSDAGRAAAGAHSGALGSPDRLVQAAFKAHGLIQVDTMEQLLETGIALQTGIRPSGGRLAALSGSGGQIQLLLDAVVGDSPLTFPALSEQTVQRVGASMPQDAPMDNPFDYWGMTDLEGNFNDVARTLANDPAVDMLVALSDFSVGPTGEGDRAARQLSMARRVSQQTNTPLVVLDTVHGGPTERAVRTAVEDGFLVLSGIREGVRALEALVQVPASAERLTRRRDAGVALGSRHAISQPLTGIAALDVLADVGIPVPWMAAVRGVDEAVAAAEDCGYPVVLKSADPHVQHKTELQAVHLGLAGPEAVKAAAAQLSGVGDGSIMVQRQMRGEAEIVLGAKVDAVLGAFVIVGLGGIWTEYLDDVVVVPAGYARGAGPSLLSGLRGFSVLTGGRGRAPVAMDALCQVIDAFDAFVLSLRGGFSEIDINPILVTGDEAVAVDCLILPPEQV